MLFDSPGKYTTGCEGEHPVLGEASGVRFHWIWSTGYDGAFEYGSGATGVRPTLASEPSKDDAGFEYAGGSDGVGPLLPMASDGATDDEALECGAGIVGDGLAPYVPGSILSCPCELLSGYGEEPLLGRCIRRGCEGSDNPDDFGFMTTSVVGSGSCLLVEGSCASGSTG